MDQAKDKESIREIIEKILWPLLPNIESLHGGQLMDRPLLRNSLPIDEAPL